MPSSIQPPQPNRKSPSTMPLYTAAPQPSTTTGTSSKRRGAETFANLRFIVGRLFRLKVPHHERPELQIGGKNAISMPHGIVIGLGTAAYLGTAWVLTDF